MAEAPRILLEHHLKKLKLPTFLRESEHAETSPISAKPHCGISKGPTPAGTYSSRR